MTISKGFVTYVNNNPKYISLVECMIDSLLEFTDLHIELCTINFDYRHSNKRVITKKISLVENQPNLYYAKLLACVESDFDMTMHIDSDAIVTPEVINMFSQETLTEFVLMPKHPWNGIPNPGMQEAMQKLGAIKTQPYLHAAAFIFTKNSKNFLKEVWDFSQSLHHHPENFDESLLNSFLWKYQKTDYYVDCFEPYFEYFKWVKNIPNSWNKDQKYSEIPNFVVNNYIAHGCKDSIHARYILSKLLEQYK